MRLMLACAAVALAIACGPTPGVSLPAVNPVLSPLTGAVTVAFVGDSVTRGVPPGDSFRFLVDQNFQIDRIVHGVPGGLTLSYIGPDNTGQAPTNRHDGINGSTTVSHTAEELIPFGVPDVIILFTGTNDGASALGGVFPGSMLTLAHRYRAAFPNVRLVVVSKIMHAPPAGAQADYAAVDAAFPAALAAFTREGIPYVEASMASLIWTGDGTGITGDYFTDDTHPNASGNVKIAAAIRPALLTALGYP